MNNVLIRLTSAQELVCYEAMSLAMTLATFDYQVQLLCEPQSFGMLINPNHRIYGMLKSLDLYEMPPVWIEASVYSDWLLQTLDKTLVNQFIIRLDSIDLHAFDNVLSF